MVSDKQDKVANRKNSPDIPDRNVKRKHGDINKQHGDVNKQDGGLN